jgi:KipI family sensor histidine kinase inhibitor
MKPKFYFYPIPNGTIVYPPKAIFQVLTSALLNQSQYQVFISLDSFVIHHNPDVLESELNGFLLTLMESDSVIEAKPNIEILPIYYDLNAPDWLIIEETLKKSREEVVQIHLGSMHVIEMYGFLPGFAYIKNEDQHFDIPRKAKPITNLEAGSLALAGNYTGIYPVESPGGWQIIGKCPIKLLKSQLENPVKYPIGTRIKFKAISLKAYNSMLEYE